MQNFSWNLYLCIHYPYYSMLLNDNIVDNEKSDDFCCGWILRIVFTSTNPFYQTFRICINNKWCFMGFFRRHYNVTKIFISHTFSWYSHVFLLQKNDGNSDNKNYPVISLWFNTRVTAYSNDILSFLSIRFTVCFIGFFVLYPIRKINLWFTTIRIYFMIFIIPSMNIIEDKLTTFHQFF